MNGKSFDIKQEQLRRLKEAFPESVAEGKVDWEKLRLTLGEELILQNERYVLNWAGKSDAFRAIQTPATATLKPQKDQSINFDTTENIFIEGENLEVLKVLQKSYYGKIKMIYIDPPYNTGNDSFIYPDKFSESKDDYLKRIGDKDEAGYLTKEGFFRKNSKENGQYHSNWLSMMYPRLFLARNLLRDDGVIFVSIDDNEVHNLRLMMNEIFGEENFVAQFIWKSRQNKDNRNVTGASIDHEYVICYGRKIRGDKRKKEQYTNPDNDSRGPWVSGNMVGLLPEDLRPNCHYDLINPETGINYGKPKLGWRYDKITMAKLISEKRILWPDLPDGRPRKKVFLYELKQEFTGFSSIVGKDTYTRNGTAEIEELFDFRVMDFPKPSIFIKELIIQGSSDDDMIIDFFAGSGTTAQAVLDLNKEDPPASGRAGGGNRKFILVQLPEKTDEDSEAYKAGYKTIADICKERIRRVIKKMSEPQMTADTADKNDKNDEQMSMGLSGKLKEKSSAESSSSHKSAVGFKVYTLEPSNLKIWRTDVIDTEEDLKRQMNAFIDPTHKRSEAEDMAWEIMLKSGYELTTKMERIMLSEQSDPSVPKNQDSSGHLPLVRGENQQVPVFSIADGELLLALESITQKALDKIISMKPKKVIALDRLFALQTDGGQAGNDQLKTNTVLQMKDAGVEFKAI